MDDTSMSNRSRCTLVSPLISSQDAALPPCTHTTPVRTTSFTHYRQWSSQYYCSTCTHRAVQSSSLQCPVVFCQSSVCCPVSQHLKTKTAHIDFLFAAQTSSWTYERKWSGALKEVEVAVNTETSSLQESVQVQLLKGVQVSWIKVWAEVWDWGIKVSVTEVEVSPCV